MEVAEQDRLEDLVNENDEGGKWLSMFFSNPKPSDADFKKARIITSHRATQVRAHGTVIGKERVRFQLARAIVNDKDELAAYLNASVPKQDKALVKPKR